MIYQKNELIDQIETIYKNYGGLVYTEFNQFGILNEVDQEKDVFNDWRGVYRPIYKDLYIWKATCNPGKNATLKKDGGAAHLCKGFHKDMWTIDIHAADLPSFAHEAFCQRPQYGCQPIKYWRDVNRNYKDDDNIIECRNDVGINGHRASKQQLIEVISDYGWACQVTQDYKDHEQEIKWAKETTKYKANRHCLFSYLLFDISEIKL